MAEKLNLHGNEALVEKVAEIGGTTKIQARENIDSVLKAVGELLKDETHDGVRIHGVGKIYVRTKKARVYRNPKTGESVQKEDMNQVAVSLTNKIKNLEF